MTLVFDRCWLLIVQRILMVVIRLIHRDRVVLPDKREGDDTSELAISPVTSPLKQLATYVVEVLSHTNDL